VAQVDGGYSSGNWGEPAAWGCSVFYPLVSNGGWDSGTWGELGWGYGAGLVTASDAVYPNATFISQVNETLVILASDHAANTLLDCQFNDTVQISETYVSNVTLGVSVVETVNTADETGGLRYYFGTTTDTANAIDTVSTAVTYAVAITETVNAASTMTGAFAIQVTVIETANAADTVVGVGYNFRSIEENAAIEDVVSTSANFAVTIVEASNVTDALSTNATFYARANVSVAIQDIVNRRRLWELIDTGTVEDWQLINTN
jgi:hypothetical protein